MGRLLLAFRAFFRVLSDAQTAARVASWWSETTAPAAPAWPTPAPVAAAEPVTTKQNPAISLLAALQRDARLVDFLKEDLSAYSDDQVGAAVREVHRDAGKLLDRIFGLKPVIAQEEGAVVDVPAGFDSGRFRLTGKLTGTPPYRGALQHHGWEAARCDLPTYTGSAAAAQIIAPAEVEVG
jgi:hypothetical protein